MNEACIICTEPSDYAMPCCQARTHERCVLDWLSSGHETCPWCRRIIDAGYCYIITGWIYAVPLALTVFAVDSAEDVNFTVMCWMMLLWLGTVMFATVDQVYRPGRWPSSAVSYLVCASIIVAFGSLAWLIGLAFEVSNHPLQFVVAFSWNLPGPFPLLWPSYRCGAGRIRTRGLPPSAWV